MPELVSTAESTQDARGESVAPGILTFIFADVMIFGVLFMAFMFERRAQIELFDNASSALDVALGLLNTLILMTSGLCVVLAVHFARLGRAIATRGWLLASMVIGAGFGVTKVIEYSDKLSHGITMLSNDFFMFYYVLTGVHFLHFLAGMVVLAVLWFRAAREAVDGPLFGWIESGALYWHMVDLLWIVIFPMLYLLGAR